MKFYIVDAFAEELFGGNPAGVALLSEGTDFPEKSRMIHTAKELRYSETAFVKPLGEKHYQLRYFTPTDEVDLCGHATIGAFGALVSEGFLQEGDVCLLETLAGQLQVKIFEGKVFLEMGEGKLLVPLPDPKELAEVLGISPEDFAMAPTMVSTGLPDILVPLKSRELLLSMNPDMEGMKALSRKLSVVGVHAFALDPEKEVTAWCRNFAPLYGIDEEAATGTANGALAYFLQQRGLLGEEARPVFLQGESMGRPSRIYGILSPEEKPRIQIGGSSKLLARGELLI